MKNLEGVGDIKPVLQLSINCKHLTHEYKHLHTETCFWYYSTRLACINHAKKPHLSSTSTVLNYMTNFLTCRI